MELKIYSNKAECLINGKTYALAYFPDEGEGSIPKEGYFGIAVHENTQSEKKVVDNVVITEIKDEKDHYNGLNNCPSHMKLDNGSKFPEKVYF